MALARKTDNHNNGKEPGYDEWKRKKIEAGLERAKQGHFASDAEIEALFRRLTKEA